MGMHTTFWVGPIAVCKTNSGQPPHPGELVEELDEAIHEVRGEEREKMVHYFGANQNREGCPRKFEPYEWFSLSQDEYKYITEPDVQAEIKWFEVAYAKEIERLREAYDEVHIKWMIVGGIA